MRVCFVSFEYPPNLLGGAGTYADALVSGLRKKGVDVFVFSRGKRIDYELNTFRVPSSGTVYWRRLFFMKAALPLINEMHKSFKFGLVHFNEPHLIIGKPKIPALCTLHTTQLNESMLRIGSKSFAAIQDFVDLALKTPVGSLWDLVTAHSVDRIISPSAHLARLIQSYCLVSPERVCVIPNGIDIELFDKVANSPSSTFLEKYSLSPGSYLLFVGRLSILKGVQYLISAFQNLKKKFSDLKLVIVGSGELESYLKSIAKSTKDIIFTGKVVSIEDKKALYVNSRAVVVPSIYEAFPMVVLEAMTCSKAVIATNVGDIPLLVRNGKNGFLAKPGDSKDIERFVSILWEDRKLGERMGALGRDIIEKEFTVDRMVDRTLEVYKSLC